MVLDDKDGVEDVVPDLAGNAEAEVEVLVVVCEVILFHVPHIRRESRVVEASDKYVSATEATCQTGGLRVVHDIVGNVCDNVGMSLGTIGSASYSQKTKAPEIIAFAMAVGNTAYANRVIGNERNENRRGGMTSLSLRHVSAFVRLRTGA